MTTLFLLHYLGGSARAWAQVAAALGPRFRCVTIDHPGFGDAADETDYSVTAMTERVIAAIRAEAPRSWALVGHSMGAKVAASVARRAEDGEDGLAGLSHIVLLAGSPPSPEPMDEDQRARMSGWFGGDAQSRRADAETYIDQNIAATLDDGAYRLAVEDVLRANKAAWTAWLHHGSREDWAERIGILQTPALVVAGAADKALGAESQRRFMMPHFAHSELVELEGAAHILPLEDPAGVARLIAGHMNEGAIGADYRALIQSDRVSSVTRDLLLARTEPADAGLPDAMFGAEDAVVMRALLDRVVPQSGFDLAARVCEGLKAGNGWRFAALPSDEAAWRAGLRTLDALARQRFGQGFAAVGAGDQDGLLTEIADGSADVEGGIFDAARMRLWFQEVRADAARAWMAHPAVLERIGYSGIAYGGDGPGKPGFIRLGPDQREEWEPEATGQHR